MTVGGSHAGVEIMLLTIISGARFVEVPVNYLPARRHLVGHRQADRRRSRSGLRMIQLALRFRRSVPRRLVRAARPRARTGSPSDEQREREQLPL